MRRYIRLAVLVPALAALPALAADSKADEVFKTRLLAGKTITGKLSAVAVDGDVKKFTVQVPNPSQDIDPAGQKKYEDVYKQYMTAVQKRDKNAPKLLPELQKAKAAMYIAKDNPIEFEFAGDKGIKVRRQELPPKEVNGKKVPYTLVEQQQQRGTGADAALPGFAATLKDLETDLYVRVYLDKLKARATTTKKDDKDAKSDGYPISMIIIVPKPPDAAGGVANPLAKQN